MPGFVQLDPGHATILNGTSAVNCAAGILGGSLAGAARDTVLQGIHLPLHATALTLTIGGLADSTGAAVNWLLSGQTTVDTYFEWPQGILNDFGAFSFTPSVSGLITVLTRAFTGGQ